MAIEFVESLGPVIETKTISLERLSKGGLMIIGTPKLTFEELNEVIGVCHHQIEVNAKRKFSKEA